MKIRRYPDGTSYFRSTTLSPSEITFRINSYQDLWHLQQLLDASFSRVRRDVLVTIPNLIDAQADRRFSKGESSGLKLVCEFLNNLTRKYGTLFKIFHPHNPEVVEAMMDSVQIIDNSYFIKEVISKVHCSKLGIERDEGKFYHKEVEDLVLVSSDAGGFKPLIRLCDEIGWGGQIHSCSKGRSFNGRKSELTQRIGRDDFFGKDILIIDDISVYGGTFKGLSKLLRQRNCGKLYLAVSHMTVQNLGTDPVTNYFDKVFSTNSKFSEYWKECSVYRCKLRNLEIINQFKINRHE